MAWQILIELQVVGSDAETGQLEMGFLPCKQTDTLWRILKQKTSNDQTTTDSHPQESGCWPTTQSDLRAVWLV